MSLVRSKPGTLQIWQLHRGQQRVCQKAVEVLKLLNSSNSPIDRFDLCQLVSYIVVVKEVRIWQFCPIMCYFFASFGSLGENP